MHDLFSAAKACLDTDDLHEKLRLSKITWQALVRGELTPDPDALPPEPISEPGRPARPVLVSHQKVPMRRLGSAQGRAALIHAVAHIEFNAINLAWDAIYRFRGLPHEYYLDWASCAHDEARHFGMLAARLAQLGYAYGDFDAHNGLWEMAIKTAHSDTARMALVPRVLEARGLDVTPGMIERLCAVGDQESADILRVILDEEVAHVAAGTRWFHYCCQRDGIAAQQTFIDLIRTYMGRYPRGPMNFLARRQAGFAEEELNELARF